MTAQSTVELEGMPRLGRLYARGVAGSAAAIGRTVTVGPADLPGEVLVVRGVRADADHLLAYQQLVGEQVSDVLPAGFVHVLAFPAATALMVRSVPLPLLGMVHVANRVSQQRAITLGEVFDVRVTAGDLRPHRRGVTVDIVAEALMDDDVVWRGTSTYLAKGAQYAGSDPTEIDPTGTAGPDRPEFSAPRPTGLWRLSADVGRRYAEVSGDRNPIHTSRLAARAFGFPRRIAHGMFTAARALADVGSGARGEAFDWEVDFARPVLIPSTVAIAVLPDADGYQLAAWNPRSGKPHLTGSVHRRN